MERFEGTMHQDVIIAVKESQRALCRRRSDNDQHSATTPDKQRIVKLIMRIHALVQKIAEYELNLTIHRNVDQYHLIQKAEELRLLYEAFEMRRIDQKSIERHYRQVYFRWRRDVRWMNAYDLPMKK